MVDKEVRGCVEAILSMLSIHLAIAFDRNYLRPFYALLESMFAHNNGESIHIHAIATEVDDKAIKAIEQYVAARAGKITFYQIADERVKHFVTMSTWTKAVYYRLYFPLLVPPTVKRLLYLDTDTVVVSNLSALFNASLDGKPVGAVDDNYVSVQPLIGISTPGEYFNSGVLLIDMDLWRTQQVSERTMEYLLNYPERIQFVDQCGLNAVLHRNWRKLDDGFNFIYSKVPGDMPRKTLKRMLPQLTIIHFTLDRPWTFLCKNPFRYLYLDYLKQSGLYTGQAIDDFEWRKLPAWVRIRMNEFYGDQPWLQYMWRRFKRLARR